MPIVALGLLGLVVSTLAAFDQAADRVLSPIRTPGQLVSARPSSAPAPISLNRRMRPIAAPEASTDTAPFPALMIDDSSQEATVAALVEPAILATALIDSVIAQIVGPGYQRAASAASKSASKKTKSTKAAADTGFHSASSTGSSKEPQGPPNPKLK